MSGALQVVGLALLGLGGAFMLGANNPFSLFAPSGVSAAAAGPSGGDPARTRRRHRGEVLGWVNPPGANPPTPACQWRETLAQLESVSLSRSTLGEAFGWSLFNWIADVACLAFAAYAAGGHPSLAGLTVAYAAARGRARFP